MRVQQETQIALEKYLKVDYTKLNFQEIRSEAIEQLAGQKKGAVYLAILKKGGKANNKYIEDTYTAKTGLIWENVTQEIMPFSVDPLFASYYFMVAEVTNPD